MVATTLEDSSIGVPEEGTAGMTGEDVLVVHGEVETTLPRRTMKRKVMIALMVLGAIVNFSVMGFLYVAYQGYKKEAIDMLWFDAEFNATSTYNAKVYAAVKHCFINATTAELECGVAGLSGVCGYGYWLAEFDIELGAPANIDCIYTIRPGPPRHDMAGSRLGDAVAST